MPTDGTVPYPTPTPVPYTMLLLSRREITALQLNYPGDVNITNDPNVVFADNFDSYNVPVIWCQSGITTALSHGSGYQLYRALPRGEVIRFAAACYDGREQGTYLEKTLTTEYDVLFLRYYAKYASNFDVYGSSHNGAYLQAHYDDPYMEGDSRYTCKWD